MFRSVTSVWRRPEQINLRFHRGERGLQTVREIFDSGADPLKLITKPV
jgi:hypothetical protein